MKRIVKKKTRVEVCNSATLDHKTRAFARPKMIVRDVAPLRVRNTRAKSRMNTGDFASRRNCDVHDSNCTFDCVKRNAMAKPSNERRKKFVRRTRDERRVP